MWHVRYDSTALINFLKAAENPYLCAMFYTVRIGENAPPIDDKA